MMRLLVLSMFLFFGLQAYSQEIVKADGSSYFKWRTNHVGIIGGGVAAPNTDLPGPKFDYFAYLGYEAVILPQLRLGVSLNKFKLKAIKLDEGYISFDANIQYFILPYNRFTPFVLGGVGYNAADDFKNTSFKLQAGSGFEFMVIPYLGVRIFADYNYLLDDELEKVIFGESNDSYIRVGAGLNYYFGRTSKANDLSGKKTIFNSNKIDQ